MHARSPQDSILDEVLVEMELNRVGVAPVTCNALRKLVTDSAVLARLDRLQEMWPPENNQGTSVINQTPAKFSLSKFGVQNCDNF